MRKIYIADNQDISRAGLMFLIDHDDHHASYKYIEDKTELMYALKQDNDAVVIIDYALFDFNDADDLLIISQRYPQVNWLIFSTDLQLDFIKRITIESNKIGVLFKESSMTEIKDAISSSLSGIRYICQRTMEMLLVPMQSNEDEHKLTPTETEILKDIALGLTTKEISAKRISSFHTINTHRKNIFRKLGVNNAHEATKYALRAGIVDSAEYYI
jgi:DNA-binding NarL/FixJ family response regulator